MKTARKALLIALCAVLLVAVSVMGTLAYLTSTTETVENTFTVGKVGFNQDSALDEIDVDVYGDPVENAGRVTENEYKLIPGHNYTKDPTVHMAADSENAWLFVKVVNDIAAIEAENNNKIHDQILANGWEVIDAANGIYGHTAQVVAGQDYVVFGEFTLADDAAVADYENASITIQALAVQADGLTLQEAWEAESEKLLG